MGDRTSESARWQNNLSSAFKGPSGIVGECVLEVMSAEDRHKEQAASLHGFTTILDSFQDCALQTVDEAQKHQSVLNAFSFAFVCAAFRRFRAALNVFYEGYYYDAASNLRSVFESVLYLGAVGQGYLRLDALFDVAGKTDLTQTSQAELQKIAQKGWIEIDRTINGKMRGKDSGLSADEQTQLELMFIALHHHVHRASSTVFEMVVEMVTEQKPPSMLPKFDLNKSSMFCNTAVCVAWAFARVIPCVSLPSRFSKDWHKRYAVLDDSFHSYLEGWEKPLGLAFRKFMESKMNFTEESFQRFELPSGDKEL